MDPGGFARPGNPVVTIVDRSTVRIVSDVPENDYAAVAPGTAARVHLLATGQTFDAMITRRSPSADPSTRTIHIEIDVPDAHRTLPVGTTGEINVEVGEPQAATEIPTTAASLRGTRATVFVVEGGHAHRRRVTLLGERGGSLFVDPSLVAGAHVVTEGRGLLDDNNEVTERLETFTPANALPAAASATDAGHPAPSGTTPPQPQSIHPTAVRRGAHS
jgi:RND family efflux transporter MFP subunit